MIKVLVVEDEPIVRKDLVLLTDWEKLGCICVGEASTGKEGIEKYRELLPELIITDIRMPQLDGLEMIRIISELSVINSGSLSTEFIILSGYSDFDYARQAMREGVQEYLVKPVDDDELYAAIYRVKQKIEINKTKKTNNLLDSVNKTESMLMLFVEYDLGNRETTAAKNVQKAIDLIAGHYIGGITIDHAAELLQLSPGYLSRIFKNETGYTFVEYLTFYRIKRAAELLKNGQAKVYEIADLVGYTDSRYFSQVFKRITGFTPKEFQERL